MTLGDLDSILVSHKRLAAMGILAKAKRVEFSFLRDQLGLSDSDLSKQLKPLAEAGYITSNRTGKGPTRRSWFTITAAGNHALTAHATALQSLLNPPVPTADAPE